MTERFEVSLHAERDGWITRGHWLRNLSYEHDARLRLSSASYLVTEKVEQFKPWTEPFINFACGDGALRPTIS